MPLEAPFQDISSSQVASSGQQRPKRCPEVVGTHRTAAFAKQVQRWGVPKKFNRMNDDKPLLQGLFVHCLNQWFHHSSIIPGLYIKRW